MGFVVKGGITTPPMKNNYFSYAPKIQFLEQPPVLRICGVPEMVVFTCDFETFCKLSKCIFFSGGDISGFSGKSMKFQNQRSVRYTPLVVRAGFELARSNLGALWPIFPAATVRVEWRIRGLRGPDDHFEDCLCP